MTTWEVIGPDRQQTGSWAGGTTTELYIHPRHASYAQRRFGFRISSATVELDRSDFTALPGYTRRIMPLRGDMRLEHEGHHTRALKPYEVDTFDGGWRTVSHGRCTDFNLMTDPGWSGDLSALRLPVSLPCAPGGYTCLYALDPVRLHITGPGRRPETAHLRAGDLLALHQDGEAPLLEIAAEPATPDEPDARPLIAATLRPL